MSRKQPVGQVRLTNIAIVKYKVKGLRFEIACFPNKVLDYRKKVEKDIKNVIQSPNVFSNVSKGSFARRDDLMEAFGTLDQAIILNIILEKGELQVTEKERQSEIANKTREIINFIAGMCVNSETKQPVSARVIEEGFKNAAFQINLTQPVKQQAMKVFHVLAETLPIERAKMKIIIASPAQYAKSIKSLLATTVTSKGVKITNIVQTAHSTEFTIIIDPGLLREITDDVNDRTNGQGDISVADLQVDTEDLLSAQAFDLDNHHLDGYNINDGGDDNDDDGGNGNGGGGSGAVNHHYNNFGNAIDIDNLASAFGKTDQTMMDSDDDQDGSDLSHLLNSDEPVSGQHLKQKQKQQQHNIPQNNYSDSDDDISFILSKTITVLKEDDGLSNGGPTQIEKMQDFTGYGRSNRNGGDLDDIDHEHLTQRRLLKTQNLSRFIQAGDELDGIADHSDGDDDDDALVIPQAPTQSKARPVVHHHQHQHPQQQQQQQQSLSKKSSLTQFLHTNIAKSMVGTQIQPLGVAASIREDKSGRVITKYDPESTLYKEFMFTFDTQENFPDDILLRQDADVLQAIKRQIALQQQQANEDFEWILELEDDDECLDEVGQANE